MVWKGPASNAGDVVCKLGQDQALVPSVYSEPLPPDIDFPGNDYPLSISHARAPQMPASAFEPAKDIPDLSGKVILVTGGNNGLGAESVLQLSKHNPAKIYLGARDESRAQRTIASIRSLVPDAKIEFLPLDLGSLKSVKQAADAFTASSTRLDVLMNNAGIMACPTGLTKEGYEVQFGTNHLGHALLTKLLLPTLQKTAETQNDVRIVNLSSSAHTWAPRGGLVLKDATTDMKRYSTWSRYGQSKLANIYYTHELARRYPSIKSVAIHPGSVRTGLISGPLASYPYLGWLLRRLQPILAVSVQEGALNQLWATISPDARSGHFYYPVAKDFSGSEQVRDDAKALNLWEWTEAELKKQGY